MTSIVAQVETDENVLREVTKAYRHLTAVTEKCGEAALDDDLDDPLPFRFPAPTRSPGRRRG